jgi:deoxyribodipyrimidine photo-lyase
MRQDLRVEDHPALDAAVRGGGPVIPVFVFAPEEEGAWAPGGASRWWLHRSLASLGQAIERLGGRLILRVGPTTETLLRLTKECGATRVFWQHRYEPDARRIEATVERALRNAGCATTALNGALLTDPGALLNRQGKPFQVFTPFYNAALKCPVPEPLPSLKRWPAPARWPQSLDLDAFALEPKPNWAGGLRAHWTPGEAGAHAALRRFLDDAVDAYSEGRDRPDLAGTSRLAPHLHFGEITPRQVLHTVQAHAAAQRAPGLARGAEAFLRQVYWREFAHHLLYHFPETPLQPLRANFARFPWREDAKARAAWQQGRTGYPIVDAGMRELWHTGWMHNRVRMIVGSFLVKHLLLPWTGGARWFWDTLLDADLANNTLGWQWVAGCGADAAPYFRIFNPMLQGAKFDPDGAYVQRWVPELAALRTPWLHAPWTASPATLKNAGVILGKTYPAPLVEHAGARERALMAYRDLRS